MQEAPLHISLPTTTSIPFEDALERVLASKCFLASNRMRLFLRHVVELTLAERTGELKEFQLGLQVFGRASSYDPRIDPVVRVEARRLRAKLEEYYSGEGIDDPVVITVPKGGYVAHFELRSPVTIPITSANLSVAPKSIFRPQLSWKFAGVAAFVAIAAILAAVLHGNGLWTRVPPSVAVLPFVDLTGDPARKYFSAGLTEEVTDELSRLKGLRVAAQTSAAQFGPAENDLRKIGGALNVDAVLEGSVEQSGGRIKVLARLERISDGSRLWSAVYNRRDNDLLDLQSEIARGIAYGLKATVNPQAVKQHLPHNQQAHDLYLKGRYEAQSLNPDSQAKAIQDFESVIVKDPEFGAAYEALGSALLNRSTALVQQPDRKRIEGYWSKALALDPDLTSAHEDVAIVAMQYDWDWDHAQRELQLALASGSGPSVEIREADYMLFHHRFSEADEYVARAQKLDPIGTSTIYNVGTIRAFEGRFAEARSQFEVLAGREKSTLVEVLRDVFDIYDGKLDRGLADLHRFEQKFPPVKLFEAIAVSRKGQHTEALDLIHSVENSPAGKSAPLYWFALAYASLQDEPNTLKWLNRSADAHEWQALFLAVDPSFSWMRDHSGMQQLKRRIGLA